MTPHLRDGTDWDVLSGLKSEPVTGVISTNPASPYQNNPYRSILERQMQLAQQYRGPIPVAEADQAVPLKDDKTKPDFSLLPLQELAAVVRVLEFGAKKYGRDNYKAGEGHSSNRLLAACLRHLASYQAGEKTDKDTDESHIAHAACCLIFMLYNQYHGKQP